MTILRAKLHEKKKWNLARCVETFRGTFLSGPYIKILSFLLARVKIETKFRGQEFAVSLYHHNNSEWITQWYWYLIYSIQWQHCFSYNFSSECYNYQKHGRSCTACHLNRTQLLSVSCLCRVKRSLTKVEETELPSDIWQARYIIFPVSLAVDRPQLNRNWDNKHY